MEKTIKNASGRLLAGFLAVIMVFSLFTTLLSQFDFGTTASAAGDDGDDTVHTNSAYSNTDYAVITGQIALVGDGFGMRDLKADLADAIGIDVSKIVSYESVEAVLAAADDISLVVFAAGTGTCIRNEGTVTEFGTGMYRAVELFKEAGVDVLLVTPGPVTEYGADKYYANNPSIWTPEDIASGENITNRLSNTVNILAEVANSLDVGLLSIYGKVKLLGEAKYMEGSTDGVYPGDYGFDMMTRWIAEYVAENYVIGDDAIVSDINIAGETAPEIDLGAVYNDVDALVLTFPKNTDVPATISVQTTKALEDQWFEAVAETKIVDEDNHKKVVSLVFETATARYIRIAADSAFPAGATASVYKTQLTNPVVTYPIEGDEVSTKHAFNIEWSAVAGADRYNVEIKNGETVVKKFTTSEDTQAIPAGIFEDGNSYEIVINAVTSGYVDTESHSATGASGTFAAADDAVYTGNSESYDESISDGKYVNVGESVVLNGMQGMSATVDGVSAPLLVDLTYAAHANDTDKFVQLHASSNATGTDTAEVIIDYGKTVATINSVFFDVAFLAANGSANARPHGVAVSYSADGTSWTAEREMSVSLSVRKINLNADTEVMGDMFRYAENIGASNVRYAKLVFSFANGQSTNFFVDGIYTNGAVESSGIIIRDGSAVLNQGVVGATIFSGEYSSGDWVTSPYFSAVAALGTAKPVELIIDLNTDINHNAVSSGNHLVTGLDIAFAVDTNAVCPSSIVVSIQKEGESTWTEVGGKVYIQNGLATEAQACFLTESIPLTMADASDVEAAYVKITLYSNNKIDSVPATMPAEGTWGNAWFAISRINLTGGQYIGSIEEDGATAAYHANYLQNTTLVGRANYGDVNNTEIWNTISWKTAPYTTSNSGYLESTGNISVGKIYWASENQTPAGANVTVPTTTKAATNIAPNATYKYANIAPTINATYGLGYSDNSKTTESGYSSGKLNDTEKPSPTYLVPSGSNDNTTYSTKYATYVDTPDDYVKDIIFKLDATYKITKVVIHYHYDTSGTYKDDIMPSISIASNDSSFSSNVTVSHSIVTTSSHPSNSARQGRTNTITFSATVGSYLKVSIPKSTGTRMGISEIEIFGEADSTPPTVTNVQISELSSDGYRVTCNVSDNVGVTRVAFPTWTVNGAQDDLKWMDGTISNGTATYYVKTSDHNNEYGEYITHIYAYDAAGNSYCYSYNEIHGNIIVPTPVVPSNVALEKNYYYTVKPGIAARYYDTPDSAINVWHAGELTDGNFATYTHLEGTENAWVGYQTATTVDFVVDLGAFYNIDSASVFLAWGGTNTNNLLTEAPAGVTVSFSSSSNPGSIVWGSANDIRSSYVKDRDLTRTTGSSGSANYADAKKHYYDPSATIEKVRFVKFSITITETSLRTVLDEIEIIGVPYSATTTTTVTTNVAPDATYKAAPNTMSNTGTNNGSNYLYADKDHSGNDILNGATTGTGWHAYHKGKLNDGVVHQGATDDGSKLSVEMAYVADSGLENNTINEYSANKTATLYFKLAESTKVKEVVVSVTNRPTSTNRAFPTSVNVSVGNSENSVSSFGSDSTLSYYSDAAGYYTITNPSGMTGSYLKIDLPYTKIIAISEIQIIAEKTVEVIDTDLASNAVYKGGYDSWVNNNNDTEAGNYSDVGAISAAVANDAWHQYHYGWLNDGVVNEGYRATGKNVEIQAGTNDWNSGNTDYNISHVYFKLGAEASIDSVTLHFNEGTGTNPVRGFPQSVKVYVNDTDSLYGAKLLGEATTTSTAAGYRAYTAKSASPVTGKYVIVEIETVLKNGSTTMPGQVASLSEVDINGVIISETVANEATVTFLSNDGIMTSKGDATEEANTYQYDISVPYGTAWSSVQDTIVSAIVPQEYEDASGTTYAFSHWSAIPNGTAYTFNGTVTGNTTLYAVYVDKNATGTFDNTLLTDGIIYDGRGTKSDFYLSFVNNGGIQHFDYVIIDLGEIYYSLTEFDVSFYANAGGVLPNQITFEVSSKLFVSTIQGGMGFEDSDWQYVCLVNEDDYIYNETTGRYSFSDDAKIASIIEGAFGRYIKVTFWYGAGCTGVDVDEIMISGSDDYDRTNIARYKDATVGGIDTTVITDAYETNTVTGTEFVIEFDEVKVGINSFEVVGAGSTAATFYISNGSATWHEVGTFTGVDGMYTLDDKVSANRVKVVLAASTAVSEIRIFGDVGSEDYYGATGGQYAIELNSGTLELDNVISIGAGATLYDADPATYEPKASSGATVTTGTAAGSATHSMTDSFDTGVANAPTYFEFDGKKLWYSYYYTSAGSGTYAHFEFSAFWEPVLNDTTVSFKISDGINDDGTMKLILGTYNFQFNGTKDHGFVYVTTEGVEPGKELTSYYGTRNGDIWTVNFSIKVNDGEINDDFSAPQAALYYIITVKENGVTYTDTLNDITSHGILRVPFSYNEEDNVMHNSADTSWSTVSAGHSGTIVAELELDRLYYGLNNFGISFFDSLGNDEKGVYTRPDSLRFQVSVDGDDWSDVGYVTAAVANNDHYLQEQLGLGRIYNYNTNFAGATAKYVRAIITAPTTSAVAIQEFWVNALTEAPKDAGGDSAVNNFDYKMLWDEDYLYIALQYEEDEVPFYTASHDYYETFSIENDTTKHKDSHAYASSSLYYDEEIGFFQSKDAIARDAYPVPDEHNLQIYEISNERGNLSWYGLNGSTTKGFTWGDAVKVSAIKDSTFNETTTDNENRYNLEATSMLYGYIIICDGYALSQNIGIHSLHGVPVSIVNGKIPQDQITMDLVWFFQDVDDELPAYNGVAKNTFGDHLMFNLVETGYSGSATERPKECYPLGNAASKPFIKHYLARTPQPNGWNNLNTTPQLTGTSNTIFGTSGEQDMYTRVYNNIQHLSWNVTSDNNGNFNLYMKARGAVSYNNYYDNIDDASSFRVFMSAANLNDTARYDYGNYDFVLDAYIIDDSTLKMVDGTVYQLTTEGEDAIPEQYLTSRSTADMHTGPEGYKLVEFKATALGMTGNTYKYNIDVSKIEGKAKMAQSENGQNLITMEIAIPFKALGFYVEKTGGGSEANTAWGNFYTKTGIEKPLGKRTLMQFDSDYIYTSANQTTTDMTGIDEFYYYVDASEFGYIIQMAPEGKGYQDMSYTDGAGYATISSVRGEVLNTTNGSEIAYAPDTFKSPNITIGTKEGDYGTTDADTAAKLTSTEGFSYSEKDGGYYFTSNLVGGINKPTRAYIKTNIVIPAGGAYFSFDWRVESETADTMTFFMEQKDVWDEHGYDEWLNYNTVNYLFRTATESNGALSGSTQVNWTGVADYVETVDIYSSVLQEYGVTSWVANNFEVYNDIAMASISGFMDYVRGPESNYLHAWKTTNKSIDSDSFHVKVGNAMVFTPLVQGNGEYNSGMFRHHWNFHNVTVWVPNESEEDMTFTVAWRYYKNDTTRNTYSSSDGLGTDDAQITNFHIATTDELGYWKNSENWDTLRLDATIADPTETQLGVNRLAKDVVDKGEATVVPAINASANNPDDPSNNTFGESEFLTLSYAAIAAPESSGNTTTTTTYFQTKNRINISASNVSVDDISKYINNAIVFTQEYDEHLSNAASDVLLDWTVLELKYNTAYNTWVLARMFEEGVDKSKFNIHPDNNTIIIALNYTYSAKDEATYGLSRDAVLFGYTNREVLKLLTPEIRYTPGEGRINEVLASDDANSVVTQFITSNVFIRENYNIARGKMYTLRNYPTYWYDTYMYTENWFRENNTEDGLAAFLAVYSETPLYYVNENGEVPGVANTDGDYREAFKYKYSSNKELTFDTNQYGNVLYVPAGVGQLTDGEKMSVYSNSFLVEALEDYAIGYFVNDGMGTPDVDVVEDIDTTDTILSYIQQVDGSHDSYEVKEDVRVREENVILDLGSVEYGLSAFKLRFVGGGEDGVVFPTSVEFAISTDGLSYSYIGSVALDDTGFNSTEFENGYASIIYTGTTSTIYGNTIADYTFDLQTEGVTARYIKATIMNHSSQNEKTFISEFQTIQNAIYPDPNPNTNVSTWVDVSEDAVLMYQETLEMWDNVLNKTYSFSLAPTTAGYLFAEDEGYADDGRANTKTNTFLAGELTNGIGGTALYSYNYDGAGAAPTLQDLKGMSVGWMKAYAPEVSLTFNMGEINDVGYVSVYALESKDSVDKITQPYNVTAYVSTDNATWRKVATVNAKDNDSSEVSLKGMDVVLETEDYVVYRYNLCFARDNELGLQLNGYKYVQVVAETDGGEDGWICLTEVEVYEGHPCYPVIDLTDSKFEKNAIGLSDDMIENQESEVRPTFFRGFYDSELYKSETATKDYKLNVVYNNVPEEAYTTNYVFGNVEQRALDGRDIPYFYGGDQLLLRVTNNQLFANEYSYKGDWVSTYKLMADSRIYYTNVVEQLDGTKTTNTTRLFTTTAVPTPMTNCDVLARDKYTGETPEGYLGEGSYYYLPIYLKNSLDYLKTEGYSVGGNAAQYINMPTNRVELSGTVIWDTNYESEYDEYADDKNGVSLNLAPLGAKTNLDIVKYNGVDRDAQTTLRFGSIWYIDDAAYYNTHTHRQQYGTLLFTLNNLNRYLTDTYPSRASYTSVFEDYGLQLTKLGAATEVTGVEEIKGITEVVKLSNVTEITKLTGVTVTTEENAKFSLTVDGALKFYTCNEDIVINDDENIGRVWKSGNSFLYHENRYIRGYKYTTEEGTRYWYCTENVDRANWVDENGHWYCPDATVVSATSVQQITLSNGSKVYIYAPDATEVSKIKILSRDSVGTAHYWTCNENVPSWTYTTIDGNITKYWYASNFSGIAGGVVQDAEGNFYATSSTMVYDGLLTTVDGDGATRYWSAATEEAFTMLADLQSIVKFTVNGTNYTFDEDSVMAGLDRFLEYANRYGEGQLQNNGNYLDFGGIVQHSRANKYYYYCNISTELVPELYDSNNPFQGIDSNNSKQNMTDLLGVYNYDQRYLEFDAIIAGIPASQKSAKIVAVPYAIYADNYEFLEFGEHLGENDGYVEDTWKDVFSQYYTGDKAQNDMRYYIYGGAVARSIQDVITAQKDLDKVYE